MQSIADVPFYKLTRSLAVPQLGSPKRAHNQLLGGRVQVVTPTDSLGIPSTMGVPQLGLPRTAQGAKSKKNKHQAETQGAEGPRQTHGQGPPPRLKPWGGRHSQQAQAATTEGHFKRSPMLDFPDHLSQGCSNVKSTNIKTESQKPQLEIGS